MHHYEALLLRNGLSFPDDYAHGDESKELKQNIEIVAAKFSLDDKPKMQTIGGSVSRSTVDLLTELQKFGAFKTLELLMEFR